MAAMSTCRTSTSVEQPPLAFHSNVGSRHVPYGPLPRQKLDIYMPKNGEVKATILYLYGGGWVSGARWYYRLFGRAMAARGFAVVVPDYHLYPSATFPEFRRRRGAGVQMDCTITRPNSAGTHPACS